MDEKPEVDRMEAVRVGYFVSLVFHMREAQRSYFKSRDKSDLRESKRLEQEVDVAIDRYRGVKQQTMFDGRCDGG